MAPTSPPEVPSGELPPFQADVSTSRTRRLTFLYIMALSLVAILSIAGQLLVQFSLRRQRSDSTVINLAGRQRMLSQKLAKSALAIGRNQSPQARATALSEMEEVLPLWNRSHIGLRNGDQGLGLPGRNSPDVMARFDQLEASYLAMKQSAEELLSAAKDPQTQTKSLQPLIDATLQPESSYLSGMNAIVSQLEQEAILRVAQLQVTERLLLGITLVVLLLEGLFIFRPAVRQIQQTVSQLWRTSEQLQLAKEAAEAANREKSVFLANVSHELRSPLHAILGTTELTQRTEVTTQQQEYLEIIADSSKSLLALVNDLLDLAKIEAGKLDLHLMPCDISHLARRVMAMFSSVAKVKGLELVTNIAPEVQGYWQVDGERLRQVLVNLINNAIKFTDAGSITLEMTLFQPVDSSNATSRLRVRVIDTGVGIPRESLDRIFLPFTQVDGSNSRRFGGAGLGLAITRRLIELMQGELGVQSSVGKGSIFWFDISLQNVSPPEASPSTNTPQGTTGQPSPAIPAMQKRLSVLVAEDAPVNRRVLEDMLTLLGHHVTLAEDGKSALTKLDAGHFDVVILDIHMPEMDGLAVAREIRAREATGKLAAKRVLALSAAALPQDRTDALAAGMDGYLTKPVTIAALSQAITPFPAQPSGAISSEPTPTIPSTRENNPLATETNKAIEQLKKRPALFRDLVELFATEGPSLQSRIEQALKAGNLPEVRLFAHRLKGQASSFSAVKLVELAQKIEEAAYQGDLETARQQGANLQTQLNQLFDQLQQAVQNL